MQPENAEFLAYLRAIVIADVKESEPGSDHSEHASENAVAELTLSMWAMGLQHDEPEAMRVLSEPTGPLVPAYWADRKWPPNNPRDVFDDLGQWGRTQGALDRLGDR